MMRPEENREPDDGVFFNREAVQHQSLGSRSAPPDKPTDHAGTPTGFDNIACRIVGRCETPLGLAVRGVNVPRRSADCPATRVTAANGQPTTRQSRSWRRRQGMTPTSTAS
jgi:hypothetical protein